MVYQKLNTEYENQKKSRTFHKKSDSNNVIETRKSMANLNKNKKNPENFINVNNSNIHIPLKKNESEKKVSMLFNRKALNYYQNLDEEKNPFSKSYSKNALKKNVNSSMSNLHNSTVTSLPNYSNFNNTTQRDTKTNTNTNKLKINLNTVYFLNFIVLILFTLGPRPKRY